MFLYTFYKKVCRFGVDVLIRQIPLCRSPKGSGCPYKIAQKIGKDPMMCQFVEPSTSWLHGGSAAVILAESNTQHLMGTRSRIGYELPDHSVVSVYCHYDGYVEHNGKILVEHYQNRDDVIELIDGGSMSSLRTRGTWDESSPLRDEKGEYINDAAGYLKYKNDREPQPLYHTERGEQLEVDHTDFDMFVSGKMGGEEYAYLFDLNGNWKAYKIGWGPVERVNIPNYVTAA